MTIIISSIFRDFIVMTSDSAITTSFSSGDRGYSVKTKSFVFQGVGCITTWGESIHNKIGKYLHEQKISADIHSVEDLAELTHTYLTEVYRPDQDNLDEVGYHVGGFDREGRARMFHIYWSFERPRSKEQTRPTYQCRDHSDWTFVFNGRNDLAYSLVEQLVQQLQAGVDVRYDPSTREGIVQFCDFVARYSAELTMEVGPPFDTNLIFPNNENITIQNTSFSPISLETAVANRLNAAQTVVIFDFGKSVEDPVATALPTGTVIPENLLRGIYPERESLFNMYSNARKICQRCGREYPTLFTPSGVITPDLCPDCRVY